MERFQFLACSFDVERALKIVEGRETVQCRSEYPLGMIRVDEEYAMGTDLTIPILVAQLPLDDGRISPLVIDGHHRLYKASKQGHPRLPAHILSVEETLSIMEGPPAMMRNFRKLAGPKPKRKK